jgi:sugar lactone lactonase YvrE
LAPDGKTIIPQCYDLARCASLQEALPRKPVYISDEYRKRTVRLDVAADGTLSNPHYFAEWGDFSSTVDAGGNVYIADGQIYVFDKDGKEMKVIETPQRPATLLFGGEDNNTLFFTSRSGFYRVRLK